MNLVWAHYREMVYPAIVPGLYKFCDLGHIIDPVFRAEFYHEDKQWENVPPEKAVFSLDTTSRPPSLSHLLPFGTYRLTIIVAAANARPVQKTLEIVLTGDWYDSEKRMFAERIGIRMI